MEKPKGVFFSIDETHGAIQLAINDHDIGYRICGPKYDGSGHTIKTHELTVRDIEEIQDYLDIARRALL